MNNFDWDMQMDTSNEVTLIRKNFWERTGNLTLQKSSLQLHQFDESAIKTLVYFDVSLEDKFEVIPIIVTIFKKNHEILGNDVLNINSIKLINEIKKKF